jgi:hypothetical protein
MHETISGVVCTHIYLVKILMESSYQIDCLR